MTRLKIHPVSFIIDVVTLSRPVVRRLSSSPWNLICLIRQKPRRMASSESSMMEACEMSARKTASCDTCSSPWSISTKKRIRQISADTSTSSPKKRPWVIKNMHWVRENIFNALKYFYVKIYIDFFIIQ